MTAPASTDVTTDQDVLLVEKRGHVLIVTLNRPDKRNALNKALRTKLRDTFDAFEADPELRCAILTGKGPAFCAGGDLKEMAEVQMAVPTEDMLLIIGSRGKLSKPVIAAINGYALAGGFLLAQDCDLAIAADTAILGVTEAKRGRGAPWAAPLISMVPKRIMMEILLTGEPISAQRAYEVGLVNKVVPADDLITEALAMAEIIAENAPLSVWAAKQTVEISTEIGRSAALTAANHLYYQVYTSADAQEGPRAFAEKRPPKWSGR